jgi:hypothetical protein
VSLLWKEQPQHGWLQSNRQFKQKKRLAFKLKMDPERNLRLSVSKKLMHLKGRCNWSLKRLKAARKSQRKAESILCSLYWNQWINVTTSSDKGEQLKYFSISCNSINSCKTKLENHFTKQTITELVVSLIVNNEEHLLRALADTSASSIILETYTSAPFIKTDDNNTTTWSKMGGKFTYN